MCALWYKKRQDFTSGAFSYWVFLSALLPKLELLPFLYLLKVLSFEIKVTLTYFLNSLFFLQHSSV